MLNDTGTEELSHLEIVGSIVHQLTRKMTIEEVKAAGLEPYFVDHTAGVYPQFASGTPWTAATIQSSGDLIADLTENLAAEQKARKTYDNILRMSDDPDVNNVIRFLREREIVHYQRFGEAKRTRWKKKNRVADNMIQPRVIVKNGSWLFSFLGYHILQIERKLSLLVAVFLYDLGTK